MEHGRPSRTTGGPPDRAPAQGSRGWRRAVAWWPTLTAEQGRQFEAERRGREQSRARRNVLIFAGLWALFAVPDVTTITDLVPLALFLRLGVVVPLIVASYPVRLLGHRRGWPLLEELPQAFVGLAVQGMTTLLLVMTRSPHAVPYALTPLPVMIGYAMILRVRPPLAVATLASICGLGVIGVLHAPIVTQEWASGTVQITVLTLVLLLVIIGRREVDLRRTFLLRSQLTNLLDARDGDLQALAEANSRLAELTELDELTRLPNRRALQARLDQWDTQDRWGVIAMVDVDRFKLFNDVHGHATGDECLRLVAQAMQQRVRADGGFVARYGGEEFTLVLPGADATAGAAVTERLRAAVEATDLHGLAVTISIGWAWCETGAPLSTSRLLQRADDAVLAAKAAGRNRVVCWKPAGVEPVDAAGRGSDAVTA